MWKRSFVATSVALGSTADEALAAIGANASDPELRTLAAGLRAPSRAARAAALASVVTEIVLAIDEATFR